MYSLWLRCPRGRSGQWKRAGLPVAERVLSAELRGELTPEYRCLLVLHAACSSARSHISSFFGIIFRKPPKTKTKKLGGGFLDRVEGGGGAKISCLTVSVSATRTTQIDIFLILKKNPCASRVKAVY